MRGIFDGRSFFGANLTWPLGAFGFFVIDESPQVCEVGVSQFEVQAMNTHVESHSDEVITKRCACGHDSTHHMVSREGVYTLIGKFWVMFGVTTEPIAIRYRCRVCGQYLGETTSKEVLSKDI